MFCRLTCYVPWLVPRLNRLRQAIVSLLCFGEAYLKYFESCGFSRENTNIDVSVFMFDLRMINMSPECEYD